MHETDRIGELIWRIRDAGITVLIVEHDMSLIMTICDRLLAMSSGRKIAEGKPARGAGAIPRSSACTWEPSNAARAETANRDTESSACSKAYRCTSAKAKSSPSSARTARAKPRCSTPSPGILRPRAGEITFNGADLGACPPMPSLRAAAAWFPKAAAFSRP